MFEFVSIAVSLFAFMFSVFLVEFRTKQFSDLALSFGVRQRKISSPKAPQGMQ